MTEEATHVTVHIRYKNVEKTISGQPNQVWLLLNKLFGELLPSFDLARKLVLNADLQTLIEESHNIVALAEEGPYILVPRNRLTDNEVIILLLLANHISARVGKMQRDGLSKEELQAKIGKDAKITSTRLGELLKNCIVAKTADEKYRLTTFGLVHTQREVLPKIKSKVKT